MDQFVRHRRQFPGGRPVVAAGSLFPLDSECACEPVSQHSVVVLRQGDDRLVEGAPVQAAPPPVLGRPDLIGDNVAGTRQVG